MPRPPKEIRPIRMIRNELGLSQAEMGQLIGVARPTIERLENGSLKMPIRVAEQYCRQTGCLLEGGEPAAIIDAEGTPFSKAAFLEHQKSVHLLAEEQKDDRIENLQAMVGLLLESAHEKQMLMRVSEDLAELLKDQFGKNGLESTLAELIRRSAGGSQKEAEHLAGSVLTSPLSQAREVLQQV